MPSTGYALLGDEVDKSGLEEIEEEVPAVPRLTLEFDPLSVDVRLTEDGVFRYTPSGDLLSVSGVRKLNQDIWKFLQTPKGEDLWHPDYGNNLWEIIGSGGVDEVTVQSMLSSMVEAMLNLKQQEALERKVPDIEMIDRIENIVLDFDRAAGKAIITFEVVTRRGAIGQLEVRL